MIATPQKIVCVGLNYRDHAEEQGVDLPERPLLFAKWPNTLIGDGEPIRIPSITENVDYEAELGVVVGRRASRVAVDDALDHVAGYVVANDVSARDLQFSDGQWVRGKSLDSFLPVSDLVPAAEVPDPQALPIRAILNGEVMQDSSTSNMIFGVAEIVSFVSQAVTLEPDDLIITGTPAGVGAFREPRVWLKPGDEITIEIDGVGAITSPVTAALRPRTEERKENQSRVVRPRRAHEGTGGGREAGPRGDAGARGGVAAGSRLRGIRALPGSRRRTVVRLLRAVP
jgi:2-keto-4-pentenoate hydratase/2-oxohepta-3-ene-1,7-dioic acid hydratase in catechol pathway